jgi:Cu-processing system permease protein
LSEVRVRAQAPFFPVVRAIGWVTFLEIVRDKILYNIIVFAFLLLGVGLLASKLTFVRPDRVILDFGLSAVNLCCVLVGIFTGASALGREFERRTIFVALSRPISRFQFTVGKFAGIALVQLCNWALLTLAFLAILGMASMNFGLMMSSSLFWGLILVLAESLLIAGLALMFSTFTTTSLSAILTIGLFLVGNNVSQIRLVATRTKSPLASGLLNTLSNILPNLENFHLGFKVTYSLPTTFSYGAGTFVYGLLFAALFVSLAGLLIHSRET